MSDPHSEPTLDPPLTEVEAWLYEHAAPERLDSGRAIYELMPSQSNRQLSFVYRPYSATSEAHWSDAARIADYAAAVPEGASRVLDIGPGDGWPSLPLAAVRPEIDVIGVDPSPLRTRVSSGNAARLEIANARFATADGARLPFVDGTFDAVVAASSLEEAAEPSVLFSEIARVLRPGGVLRVSYQNWTLETPQFETVQLWAGRDAVGRGHGGSGEGGVGQGATGRGEPVLLYTYSRRVREPAVERRYTLVLPASEAAKRIHDDALMTAAQAPRAYGETLLEGPWAALGVPLLKHLAPLALRSTVVELRRWTTGWLIESLRAAGFADVRGTAHPGELARHVARDLLANAGVDAVAARFEQEAAAIGRSALEQAGDEMVVAVR
ncbi:MAG TPA: class I SAM-dependent methyltransferase [Dehalococcoidia bacterium]|nr:class I SAM-dependent methyltransferase [Dehalococcoidia bacterium]